MNKPPLNILIVEDTPSDAMILQRFLRIGSLELSSVLWVQSIAEAEEALANDKFDIILTDLGLSDTQGVNTVQSLRNICDTSPLIALTGLDDDSLGLATIQAGANDYLPKASLSEPIISRAIVYTIERFAMAKKIVDSKRLLENKNERLAQMYKMSQQFVDNVSHEFRTPLTVIREFAAIVRDGIDGPVTAAQEKRLSTLIARTDDLAKMVDDLLDTSRLEAGLLKTCRKQHSLSAIVNQVEAMFQTKTASKQIKLCVENIPENLDVFCDDEKMRRVLINLLANAIKFTPQNGTIRISAAMEGADRVCISVIDSGPGIAAEDLKRIFNRFQQVEAHHRMASCKGFGLGLSIARALATLNLGSLKVSSTQGCGSQFSVLVPTSNLDSILNCYFDQLNQTQSSDGRITLYEVYTNKIAHEHKEEVHEIIDEFLRASVKSFDLVVCPRNGLWLLFECRLPSDEITPIQRLAQEWKNLQANHYGDPLPNLIFNALKESHVSDTREPFKELAISRTNVPVMPAMGIQQVEHQNQKAAIEPKLVRQDPGSQTTTGSPQLINNLPTSAHPISIASPTDPSKHSPPFVTEPKK